MILSCPQCPKTYDVPASALPPGGREVACSACGCVWFERGRLARAAAGACAADVAYAPAPETEVIEAEYETVGETRERPAAPAAIAAPDDAAPHPSPARAQQTTLTVAYAAPQASEAEATRLAAELLSQAAASRLRRLRDAGLTLAGTALGTLLHVTARLRGRPAPVRPTTPGDAAARDTRAKMRARAANAMTPARALGWTAWAGISTALVLALTMRAETVQALFPPAATLYALVTPPSAPPGLRVQGALGAFAMSSQGPAVTLTGAVVNEGDRDAVPQVTMTVQTPDGPLAQPVALPPVALPPGGERPFTVRALVPEGSTAVALTVTAGEATREGLALQTQGPGWSGHAGPPQLGAAPEGDAR